MLVVKNMDMFFRASSYDLVFTVEVDGNMLDGRVDAIPEIALINTKLTEQNVTGVLGLYVATERATRFIQLRGELTVIRVKLANVVVLRGVVPSVDLPNMKLSLEATIRAGNYY